MGIVQSGGKNEFIRYYFSKFEDLEEYYQHVIAEKFVSPSVMKKSVDMDGDVLIDAQDCAEDNIRTLTVVPLSNDWLCVSYLWRSPYKDVGTKRKVVYIKVKEQGKSFFIEDATTKKPDLRK